MGTKTLGLPSIDNPYISPHYTVENWLSLDLNDPDSPDWQQAVEIFCDRINGRFLKPVREIANHPDLRIREFSGFVIIAIDCLLIETLYQFYMGFDKTRGEHYIAFWKFFKDSEHFESDFNSKNKARIFYSHFRCGILHQAQTKKSSKIRIDMPEMVQLSYPGHIDEGLIVDRARFHQALLLEISDYANQLRNPFSQHDFDRRDNFIQKMTYIVS